jgi:hypothetical protein
MTEEDTAGACGSLYGLCPRIIRTPSATLPRPGAKLRSAFDRRYDQYLKVFDRLDAHLPVGGAIQFTENRLP